jgi:hypothetical protein
MCKSSVRNYLQCKQETALTIDASATELRPMNGKRQQRAAATWYLERNFHFFRNYKYEEGTKRHAIHAFPLVFYVSTCIRH